MTSTEAVRYTANLMERIRTSTVPTSDTAATATVIDGFTTAQSDHMGGSWSFTRQFLSTGMLSTTTDPRGSELLKLRDPEPKGHFPEGTAQRAASGGGGVPVYGGELEISVSMPHIAGRALIQTDGEGNQTTTSYTSCCDQPASITDALGNVINYSYDIRNRKVAESPRRLVGGLEKPAQQGLPEGRRRNGVRLSQLYTSSGTLATSYSYTPFGAVTATGNTANPIQWSSEIVDSELGLVYYNYRHYNPQDGRWINRDPIAEQGGLNLYAFVGNMVWINDKLGNVIQISTDKATCSITIHFKIKIYAKEIPKENVPIKEPPYREPNPSYAVFHFAMQNLAKIIKSAIEREWSGFEKNCCEVLIDCDVDVIDKQEAKNKKADTNYIEIDNSRTRSLVYTQNGRSNTGEWRGYLHEPEYTVEAMHRFGWEYAHEAGHLAGLEDQYNTESGLPNEGYEGRIMASYYGEAHRDDIGMILKHTECPCDKKK